MHEVGIFGLPPLMMQFLEFEPYDRIVRYRAQFSWAHAGMLWFKPKFFW